MCVYVIESERERESRGSESPTAVWSRKGMKYRVEERVVWVVPFRERLTSKVKKHNF